MPSKGEPKTGGRKKGSLNKQNQEIRDRAMYAGMTPLELMIMCMKEAFTEGEKDKGFLYAKDIAPYVHPKLAAIMVQSERGHKTIDQIQEDELYAIASSGRTIETQLSAQEPDGVYTISESQLPTCGPSSDNLQ